MEQGRCKGQGHGGLDHTHPGSVGCRAKKGGSVAIETGRQWRWILLLGRRGCLLNEIKNVNWSVVVNKMLSYLNYSRPIFIIPPWLLELYASFCLFYAKHKYVINTQKEDEKSLDDII